MMNKEQLLLKEIERYRHLLNERSKDTPLPSDEMVNYSRQLDILLNEYDALINQPDISSQKRKTERKP